jgi:hypothetical protein
MIPNAQTIETVSNGITDSAQFGISLEDSPHLMKILRDGIYTDKILAVLREYSANAWDAHREVGKGDLPIKVTLPTHMAPTLKIRDFGPGLSPENAFRVYAQYGKSTKRASNNAVGMLGIGSKSGFSYASMFLVTTWNGGNKYVYSAALDRAGIGTLSLMHQESCGDETGTEIEITAKSNDIYSFEDRAKNLFQYFVPRPEINIALPEPVKNEAKLVNGIIRTDGNTSWIAVMGCVAYRVDMSQLREVAGFDGKNIDRFGGVLYFNIGDVGVSASREELEYSDKTKAAIVEKFNALVDEYVQKVLADVKSHVGTSWEKRVRAQDLNKLGLAPKDDMFAQWVIIKETFKRDNCSVWRGSELAASVAVAADARFVVQDDFLRTIKGYNLGAHDYLIKPKGRKDLAAAVDDMNQLISLMGIDGIPVVYLSTLNWVQTSKFRGTKVLNVKHRVKNFRLMDKPIHVKPWSNNWETETEREATKDDVYVLLSNFKATKPKNSAVFTDYNFYYDYQEDRNLAKIFGITMPEVYGYKVTATSTFNTTPPMGIEYNEWRKEFRKNLITDAAKEALKFHEWSKATSSSNYRNRYYNNDVWNTSRLGVVRNGLGANHAITVFLTKIVDATDHLGKMGFTNDVLNTLTQIAQDHNVQVTDGVKIDIRAAIDSIYQKYPMLTLENMSMAVLSSQDCKKWFDYIKLVDKN